MFSALLREKVDVFRAAFTSTTRQTFVDPTTGKLRHAGEFGAYREALLRDFLRLCVPARLDIGNGFLINAFDEVSTQTDVVIYDKSAVPRVESNELQRFFPVEGICAVGEVKSRLTKSDLADALNKLARVKATADKVSSEIPMFRDQSIANARFSRENCPYDQLVSFLVCESFGFDHTSLPSEVADWYDEDIKPHHRHNMVLSISDGLLLYADANNKSWIYPATARQRVKNRFVRPSADSILHFHLFCAYMYTATSSTTILFPEMTRYMPHLSRGVNCDEP